jgi:hypothetical protein
MKVKEIENVPSRLFSCKPIEDTGVCLELTYNVDDDGRLMDDEGCYILDEN